VTWEDSDTESHAVSFGRELAPPSPKCRTSPQRGFVSEPIGGNLDINIFSKIVDTVWDFPDPEQVVAKDKVRRKVVYYIEGSPCTPQMIAEKGAF
jgi:hypothetical protein